ncbi:hypothetical protein JCM16358_06130 [Halanaerocella petrolearia]
MKVAVSVNNEGEIIPHLGKCKLFKVFKKDDENIQFIEDRITDGNHQNHIIEDINDCDIVISGQIGKGMIKNLAQLGIEAIVEEETDDPIKAISKI